MSTREALHIAERRAIEKDLENQRLAPIRAAEQTNVELLREINQQETEIRIRELRTRLTTQPSPDFGFLKYVGNDTPEEIQKKVIAAEDDHAKSSHIPDNDRKVLIGFAQANWNLGYDLTSVEVWAAMYAKLCELLEPKEAPVVSVPDATGDSTTENVNPFKAGSREADNFDREQYAKELLTETQENPLFDKTCQEIVDASGKKVSGGHMVQFRIWLDLPVQRRIYLFTREGIRLAFSKYFGDESFLSQQELDDIRDAKALEALTAREYARVVSPYGVTNVGADPTATMGYVARRN